MKKVKNKKVFTVKTSQPRSYFYAKPVENLPLFSFFLYGWVTRYFVAGNSVFLKK